MKKTLSTQYFYKKLKFFYSIVLGTILLLGCSQLTFAQGSVGVGTLNPDASAVLDVVSTSKGVLLPRLTVAQRDAIATPANGLIVYNSSDSKFNYWDGAKWEEVGGGITWFSGQGQPAGLDNAKLNDLYLDELTGDTYQRVLSGFPPPLLAWTRLSFDKRNKKQVTGTSKIVPAGSSTTLDFLDFSGVGTNSAVVCSPMFNLADGLVISQAWVSAPGVVTVKFFNGGSGVATLVAGNYQIAIF
ncbi:MAG TPA: hypothetical protein VFM79_09665 [Pelobium sp.]|nr:hypothetical protein [Pelobium sp.]